MIFFFALLTGCSKEANLEQDISINSEINQTISSSIMENFGYRHEIEDDAVKLIEFDEETGKMKIIVSTYAFEDESYEEFKADTLDSCANVLQDVKRHLEVEEATLLIETPIENADGNPDYNGTIFNMVFDRKNLNSISFHELDPLNLPKKANFYFQAPVTE